MAIGKRLGNNDVGSPTKAGGNDWDEIYDFLNGVLLAGKSATIRTQLALYAGTVMKAVDVAQTDDLIDLIGNVNVDQVTVGSPRVLATPRPVKLYPGTGTNPTLEARTDGKTALGGGNRRAQLSESGLTAPRTITFPDFDARLASITEIPAAPEVPDVDPFQSIRQTGTIQGHIATANAGEGLLRGVLFDTAPVLVLDGNGGPHYTFNTGTTVSTRSGMRSPTTVAVRQSNPEFFCKFAASDNDGRGFVGFSSLASQPAADCSSLNNASGFGFSWNDDVSGFLRHSRNDGDAATEGANFTTDMSTNPISVWMKLYDDLAKVDYKIWTTNKGDPLSPPTEVGTLPTTELPADSTLMYYHVAQNNSLDTISEVMDHWVSKIRLTGEFE